MRRMLIYVGASVVGGCEDEEFSEDSLSLWRMFIFGAYIMGISEHTLRELVGAPESVRRHLQEVPESHRVSIIDNEEADDLAEAYLAHKIVGPGSQADAFNGAFILKSRML